VAEDLVIEQDVLPLRRGVQVVNQPRLVGVVGRAGDDDGDVHLDLAGAFVAGTGMAEDDDVTRKILEGVREVLRVSP